MAADLSGAMGTAATLFLPHPTLFRVTPSLLVESEDELVGLRVHQALANDVLHVLRVVPEAIQDLLLLLQAELELREAFLTPSLDLLQAPVLRARLPEEHRGHPHDGDKNQQVETDDDTADVHERKVPH